jgi:hypothetical protein
VLRFLPLPVSAYVRGYYCNLTFIWLLMYTVVIKSANGNMYDLIGNNTVHLFISKLSLSVGFSADITVVK